MQRNFEEQSDKCIKKIEENFRKELEQNEEHSFDRNVSFGEFREKSKSFWNFIRK